MQSKIYHFGRYRIDPTRHEFWDGDELVPVQLKVFECLAYLIEHRDRAVCRDELISAVWGKVDLNDNILSQIIGRARQAVGDSGEQQRVIRTVPRFGYCWVQPAGVSEVRIDDNLTPARARPVMHRLRKTVAWGSAAMVVLALSAALLYFSAHKPGFDARDDAVLVLPVTAAGEGYPSWIRLGVMDLIVERLRETGLPVVPSDNTVALISAFEGGQSLAPDDLQSVVRTAAVSVVIETVVEILEQGWRVSLRAVDDDGPSLLAQGDGPDVIAAAVAAADDMAVLLGRPPVQSGPVASGAVVLEQQVRAAVLTSRFDEARLLLEKSGSPDDLRVRYQLAYIDLRTGRYQEAREAFRVLIRDIPPETEPVLRARVLHGLAFTQIRSNGYALAEPYVIEAMRLLDGVEGYEARNVMGELLMARAVVQRVVYRDLEAARADYARARVIFESVSDHMAVTRLDANLGILLHDFGRHAEAIPMLERAAERLARYGNFQEETGSRFILALAYYWSQDIPSALAETQRLDALLSRANEPHLAEQVELARSMILSEAGRLTESWALLSSMLSADTGQDQEAKGLWPEYVAARIALASGRPVQAAHYARAALDRTWDIGVLGNIAHTWWILLRAELALGDDQAAAATVLAATQWSKAHTDNRKVMRYMALLDAEYALYRGDFEAAGEILESAWQDVREKGVPLEIVRVAQLYVEALIRMGKTETAGLVVAYVAPWADRSYRAALLQVRLYHALGELDAWRSALAQAQALAGDHQIPSGLLDMTASDGSVSARD